MATFSRGDVVKVPFPYTDTSTRQARPALVVSAHSLEEDHGLLWIVMITSATNRGWTGDVAIPQSPAAGLPVASVVRTAKLATIERTHATRLGRVRADTLALVDRHLQRNLSRPQP